MTSSSTTPGPARTHVFAQAELRLRQEGRRRAAESSALEQFMIEQLLEAEASKRGMDGIEALLKVEVEDKVTEPTEEEIEQFYTVMQRQLRGAPLESVRNQVVGELVRRKQAEIAQAYITQLKDAAGGSISLPFPDLPRVEISADDDPFLGAEDAEEAIAHAAAAMNVSM